MSPKTLKGKECSLLQYCYTDQRYNVHVKLCLTTPWRICFTRASSIIIVLTENTVTPIITRVGFYLKCLCAIVLPGEPKPWNRHKELCPCCADDRTDNHDECGNVEGKCKEHTENACRLDYDVSLGSFLIFVLLSPLSPPDHLILLYFCSTGISPLQCVAVWVEYNVNS